MKANRRAKLLALVSAVAITALCASACGSSSSSNGSAASAAKSGTVPPGQVATGPKGPAPKTRVAKFSPAVQQAFVKFAQCMRSKGIQTPEPNITGPGPVFDPRQMDTKSPNFAAAIRVCRTELLAATRAAHS